MCELFTIMGSEYSGLLGCCYVL